MNDIATIETNPAGRADNAVTPMAMLDRAVQSGASIETLEKLMALQERWETNQARRAFDAAMAAAKAEIPTIEKNRKVDYKHKSGAGRTNYRHEDLAQIANIVTPILAKHGLSYRFRTTSEINQPVSVTCIISHRDGHFEENTLLAGRDESGNKNSIQAVGSTITYLQRYTLKAALGLAAANDDDGKSAESEGPINADQAGEIRKLIEETGTDIAAFCNYLGVEAIPDIPTDQYGRAIKALNTKRSKANG